MSSKNFYGLTGDVTVDGGILNVGNAQLYANTETSNVGIGTTNAEFKLDVHGDANVENLYATYLHGDGSNIENIVSSQWEGSPGDPIYYTSNVGIANTSPVTKTLQVGSNLYVEDAGSNVIHVTGNVYADYFVGDGSQLTGIAASLDQIVDQGNTVSNTIQLVSGQDATSNVGLVTHEGVSISVSNANPTGEYQFGVGSNLLVNVYSSNVLTVGGNVFAQKMTLGSVTVTPAYNLQQITETGPTTNQTLVLSNVTTGLTADANVVVNGNVTAGSVITSGNVNAGNVVTSSNIEVGGDLSVTGNVYIDDMRVAEVASNLVTYDSTTGELMDSGGLFSNKLAVVSEQPPIALTGASTVVTNHGTYTIEASSGTVVNLFDKNDSTKWVTDGNYSTTVDTKGTYGGSASLAGHGGEWVKITMPYKTILRHIKIESTNQSVEDIELVGLNADGLTWTPLKTETGLTGPTHTIIVNATTHHRTYGLIVEKTNTTTGRSAVEIGDLKLFTESFSIDGGKVEMATSAVMGGETTMDQHGPHSRNPKAVPLKKYPEIVFEDGKFDRNDSTNTYTQAGYTVSSSPVFDSSGTYAPWRAFDSVKNLNEFWCSRNNAFDTNGDPTGTISSFDPGNGAASVNAEYITVTLPHKIKLSHLYLNSRPYSNRSNPPRDGYIYGSDNGTDWTLLKAYTNTGFNPNPIVTEVKIIDVGSTDLYNHFALLVTKIYFSGSSSRLYTTLSELELYGYEELATQGDTSVDTTFTSIMNTPQTTGANVYVDGSLGETFTNRVTGPDATGPSATYDETGKYWELNGTLTSNIAVEANTFLEGDAPHSVSVWFNSSNLEANVSNTCVFSVSDQEKLDSMNLDLQSNTWHNLTYAYQGEGGSRVTYLDGRKVAEDQAEDTFGEYPPFAMTGYAQGGYVVSASNELSASYPAWKAFDDSLAASYDTWVTGSHYSGGTPSTHDGSETTTYNGTSTVNGEWIQLELPHKIKLSYYSLKPQIEGANDIYNERMPGTGKILGSNDGINWYLIHDHSLALSDYTRGSYTNVSINTSTNTKAYKYIRFVIETTAGTETITGIGDMKLYGHRENDLVRLPDPTNVLKYPHIPLTNYPDRGGPGRRGYVATTSGAPNPAYDAQHAFNGVTVSGEGSWHSAGYYQTTGDRLATRTPTSSLSSWTANGGSTTGELTTHTGEWVKIQLPHKIVLSSIILKQRTGVPLQKVRLFSIVGSNDDTNWFLVHQELTRSGTSSTLQEPDPNTMTGSYASVAFKYFAIVIHAGVTDNIFDHVAIGEWELYGTGVDSIPIQIGGGNIDRVANFRVYDKFIGEDQALEIWDAQKDTFRGVKNSVTLHKGRLGIGTTEPEGRLAVLDEPNGLEEFPPRAMTGYKTYFEGHGEFCVSGSSYSDNSLQYAPWRAFDGKYGRNTSVGVGNWLSSYTPISYDSSGNATGNNGILNGVSGEYLILELPYKVKMSKVLIYPRQHNSTTVSYSSPPKDGKIWGRNDVNEVWTEIASYTNLSYGATKAENLLGQHPQHVNIDATQYYKYIAFQVTTINITHTSFTGYVNLQELRYFGTREQGQSVLHDGQLTLTKSLNVPRIGPALDADDTPRRDRLVVEYNTSTNPTFEGAVRDTSGRGNDGVFYGGASYDATEKALVFDGTTSDQYVHTLKYGTSESGNIDYSVSLWFNPTTVNVSRWRAIFAIGVLDRTQPTDNNGDEITLFVNNGTNALHLQNGGSSVNTGALNAGQWVHIVVTYDGTNRKIYLDGSLSVSNGYTSLNLPKEMLIRLAQSIPNGGSEIDEYMDCKISNFKTWFGAALTAEEVKTLYDMGRCDEGHHVVNFSKTRVGIGLGDGEAPRAALDVRGDVNVEGRVSSGHASGGNESVVDGYKIHTFTSSSNFNVVTPGVVEYLIIGGGGGGGGTHGGGGGGGGFIQGHTLVKSGSHSIVVGGGGAGSTAQGANGVNSTAFGLTAVGGGGGGRGYDANVSSFGNIGGSSGGSGPFVLTGSDSRDFGKVPEKTYTNRYQGNGGGGGNNTSGAGHGGGGGGAGGSGGNATTTSDYYAGNGISGAGGSGLVSYITGSMVIYAGGGSGGRWNGSQSINVQGGVGGTNGGGGIGGANGASGMAANAGGINTGGGGGGGGDAGGRGGNGGSGIIVLRYPI
jgi:hypothetical protein